MKIVYLADICWVTDYPNEKEYMSSIVEDFDRDDVEKIREIAIEKFKKALEYMRQDDKISLIEDNPPLVLHSGSFIQVSQLTKLKSSVYSEAYMEVSFRPVLKADGWIFELEPVKANRLFVDSNFRE